MQQTSRHKWRERDCFNSPYSKERPGNKTVAANGEFVRIHLSSVRLLPTNTLSPRTSRMSRSRDGRCSSWENLANLIQTLEHTDPAAGGLVRSVINQNSHSRLWL